MLTLPHLALTREALIEAGYAAAQSRADALKKSRTDHPSEDITHLWKDHVPVPLTKAPSSETPLAEVSAARPHSLIVSLALLT